MPTLLLLKGLRFFFYSNEGNEPMHVHVVKGNAEGKLWLEPSIKVVYLHGFTAAEERDILEIVQANHEPFRQKWNEYFNK